MAKMVKFRSDKLLADIEKSGKKPSDLSKEIGLSRTYIQTSAVSGKINVVMLKLFCDILGTDVNNYIVTRDMPPTLEQVKAYCSENRFTVDPEEFFNHYEEREWCVGPYYNRTRMTDWVPVLVGWEKRTNARRLENAEKKEDDEQLSIPESSVDLLPTRAQIASMIVMLGSVNKALTKIIDIIGEEYE